MREKEEKTEGERGDSEGRGAGRVGGMEGKGRREGGREGRGEVGRELGWVGGWERHKQVNTDAQALNLHIRAYSFMIGLTHAHTHSRRCADRIRPRIRQGPVQTYTHARTHTHMQPARTPHVG